MLFLIAKWLAFVFAHVARTPFNVDSVDVGKMPFQCSMCFKHGLAHFARASLHSDVVHLNVLATLWQGVLLCRLWDELCPLHLHRVASWNTVQKTGQGHSQDVFALCVCLLEH